MERLQQCHVILAVDIRACGEPSRQALADRIRSDTEKARQCLERWLKERDPDSVVSVGSGTSIAPAGWVSASEAIIHELLDKKLRPAIVEAAVLVGR